MNRHDTMSISESPFFDEGELLTSEAPPVAERTLDSLLNDTPFHTLEIEHFEAEDELLQLESGETTYEGVTEKQEEADEDGEGDPEAEPKVQFEDPNARSTTAIAEDFSLGSLANGTLGAIPQSIRNDLLSGKESDLWDLTNRVFWDKHPDQTGKSLDPKDPKQKGLIAEYGRMTRDVKALLWLKRIVELLDKHRDDVPRDFLLGWMAKESDGRVSVVTQELGERGYFQIHPAEAREILNLKDSEFRRVSTDREFSIKQGIRLVQAHRTNIASNFTVADPSELLWMLTKARHGLPGLLKAVLTKIEKSGKPIEWKVVAARMRKVGDRGVSSNVEQTMRLAANLKALADLVPAPSKVTPEITDETSLAEEETGVIGDDDRVRVKNTFRQPYQWICKIALQKNGKDADYGTGFLITDRHVLTAAHVVHEALDPSSGLSVNVKIAFNWDTDLGDYAVDKIQIPARYKSNVTPSTFDYALLTLSDAAGSKKLKKLKGQTLGHFARASVAAADIQGATGDTAGYPTEKDKLARKMYHASGRLRFAGDRPVEGAPLLQYAGDVTKGQSGSPVWLNRRGGIELLGIAIAASSQVNYVVQLTPAVWTQIDTWMGGPQNEYEDAYTDEYLEHHDHDEEDDHDHELESSDAEYELELEALVPDAAEDEYENVWEADVPALEDEAPALAKPVAPRPGAAPGSANPCADQRSIADSQPLIEPFARPCCALHPTFPMDQVLRIEDASPHFYGEKQYPLGSERNGYVYTCSGGFVDLGHAREWLDWTGYLAVHAKRLLPGGGELELSCEGGKSSRSIQFKAQGELRSDELCVYLAQRIAYQLALWHEIRTGFLGHRYTAFSPEDNYSNLLGTYMGRDALMTFRKKPFNEAAALAIKHWLKRLGAVSQSETRAAFDSVKDVWWKHVDFMTRNDLLLKRHFDALGPVAPMLVPAMCAGKKAFPLPVPTIVQTPRIPGVMVKTDLRKLYVLKLGIETDVATKLTGTAWAGKTHITPDDFNALITHVKTLL